MKTAIVTDSNSGITQALSKELGIFTIPMPVLINGEQFPGGTFHSLRNSSMKNSRTIPARFPPHSPALTMWPNSGQIF